MVLFFIAISVTPSAVASCFKLTTFRERLIRAHELGRRQPALHSTVGNSASSYTPPSVRAFQPPPQCTPMLTLFRRRRYHAWYNVQTQEYLDLRLGLPVSAPVSGHQPGEVGYLEAGSIHTIPRRLTPQADDKRASTSSFVDEHFKEITKGLREEPGKSRSEKLTNCGGAECEASARDDDDR